MSAADLMVHAAHELDRADGIRNANYWTGDRDAPALHHALSALTYATLSVAAAVREAGDSQTKAIYDGRI